MQSYKKGFFSRQQVCQYIVLPETRTLPLTKYLSSILVLPLIDKVHLYDYQYSLTPEWTLFSGTHGRRRRVLLTSDAPMKTDDDVER